ncbi:MAG: hypothetical protein M9914_10815 [Trueperaceae bacterium]|nr:hypothetical protein [Trueperaceae bacterium]MCW5819433.1 hypothetical protein [Trueperaceae bacterium]
MPHHPTRDAARTAVVTALLLTAFCGCAGSRSQTPPPPGRGPDLAGCPMLPADNIWNARVDGLPIMPPTGDYVASIGAGTSVHADFGSGLWEGAPIGIPFTTVAAGQPTVTVSFYYPEESDRAPYPIPRDAPVEGAPPGGVADGGDRHVLVIDVSSCVLYELFDAESRRDGSWAAGSGAVFDLRSNALRPDGWTSADAAGLPILPGLVRYDEVAAGEIAHAIRFTAPRTRDAHVWPARHDASSHGDPELPPMGQRFRLRADFDASGMAPEVQVIVRAMQRYGLVLADNGSSWFLSGAPDERWDNEALQQLKRIEGSDFEAVDVSGLMADPDSGQVR